MSKVIPISHEDAFAESCRIIGELTVVARLQARHDAEKAAAQQQPTPIQDEPETTNEVEKIVDLRQGDAPPVD